MAEFSKWVGKNVGKGKIARLMGAIMYLGCNWWKNMPQVDA